MVETEMVDTLHAILEMICVLILIVIFSNCIEHAFCDIVGSKVKSIESGIIYSSTNATDFFSTCSKLLTN